MLESIHIFNTETQIGNTIGCIQTNHLKGVSEKD